MRRILFTAAAALLAPVCLFAQDEPVDQAMMQKIRTEGMEHSQVAVIAHYLTDVNGPRLTNSPGYKTAAKWAAQTMQQWGLQNAALEPWGEFGKSWGLAQSYLSLKAPYFQPIIAYPKAWTIGTKGAVTANVLMLDTLSEAAIDQAGAAIKGKIVIIRPRDTTIVSAFKAYATRYTDTTDLNKLPDMYMVRENLNQYKDHFEKMYAVRKYLAAKGAAALLSANPHGRDGTLFADGRQYYAKGYNSPCRKW